MSPPVSEAIPLPKCPSGIGGLDEITEGGLPRGRTTLVVGGPGCGKTLFAAEFLVRGATLYGEPGVLMVFEETAADVVANVASLGFDMDRLVSEGKIYIDHVRVVRQEIEETGEYDLDGLFIRLSNAIDKVGARRVALDTLETLFSGFDNPGILRAELKRLFQWLKDRGVTAVITGERGERSLTRHGLEEYVSDCVISLDHRIDGQISTRRLRIVKYRGSRHGTNEYPFLIDADGFTIVPITSAGLEHEVSEERVSTGIEGLDEMLGGEGLFRGTSVLISGTAGTGKTTTSAHFADAACRRGERTLYFAFEESPAQITRNMHSIGLDLRPHVQSGLLLFHAARPSLYGLETHLAGILRAINEFTPRAVVLDPITSLLGSAPPVEVRALVTRVIDVLKVRGITAIFTTLTGVGEGGLATDVGVSSLVDTWILLSDLELNGERNRGLFILKSRGMPHSNQIREFILTSDGVRLIPAYLGAEGVLTGSSRVAQESRARMAEAERQQELGWLRLKMERKRKVAEGRIALLQAEMDAEAVELEVALRAELTRHAESVAAVQEIARSRFADVPEPFMTRSPR